MENEQQAPVSTDPSRRSAAAWEIVCPDGGVRHFPYASQRDAEYDATLCTEEGCQLFPESQWLEPTRRPCQGGPHRIVVAKRVQRDSTVPHELSQAASP